MKILAAIILSVSATTVAAARSYEFPVDPKAGYGYVDDASLKAAIPSLHDAGGRLATCINPMFFPASDYIDFSPTVTGAHTAKAHRLLCSADKVKMTCREAEGLQSVVFDIDPADSFELGAGVDLQDALNVYRAFRDAQVEYKDGKSRWIKGLPLRHIAREGSHYTVLFADCGCHEKWQIELRRVDSAIKVVADKSLTSMCI